MLDKITPVILTFNEAPNIHRTLSALKWATRVVVVDSFSTDETLQLLEKENNVQVFQRQFDNHAAQWNFAISKTNIETEWILALDADYVLSPRLVDELCALSPKAEIAGFWTYFDYCVFGKPLRGSAYPPVTTLFRRSRARYVQDGHTQRVVVDGIVASLVGRVSHDDRKSLSTWLSAQSRYMELEAKKLGSTSIKQLSFADCIRRIIGLAPFLMFFYCAFVKGNLLDGRAGLYYSLQRTLAELLLALHLLRIRISSK